MRNKTRNGLFDEHHEIKSQPPDGDFDHARLGGESGPKGTQM